MALNTRFEAYKVQRLITRNGKNFDFFRPGINDVGESTPIDFEGTPIASVEGVYHESTFRFTIEMKMTDTTQTRSKKMPMVLCLWSDEAKSLQIGDVTIINGRKFKVVAITNVQEWNIICDISLEIEDDGSIAL